MTFDLAVLVLNGVISLLILNFTILNIIEYFMIFRTYAFIFYQFA